jgi:hypothetical protein
MCHFYPDWVESATTDRTRAKTSGVNSGSGSTTSRSANLHKIDRPSLAPYCFFWAAITDRTRAITFPIGPYFGRISKASLCR